MAECYKCGHTYCDPPLNGCPKCYPAQLKKEEAKAIFARIGKPFNKEEMMMAIEDWRQIAGVVKEPIGYIIKKACDYATERRRNRKVRRVGKDTVIANHTKDKKSLDDELEDIF